MRTYYLVAHFFLAIHNPGASAKHANTTESSHTVAAASAGDALVNTALVNGSTGWLSFDVTQLTVPTAPVVAQDNHCVLSAPEFAKVELHLGGLHGSGVIELTSSPAALTMGDHVSEIVSPQCTPQIQSIPDLLPAGNQSTTTCSNNITNLAALPTPTTLFNNTNFSIPRLSTLAAPALQSLSGDSAGKSRAVLSGSVVTAVASLCFIVFM